MSEQIKVSPEILKAFLKGVLTPFAMDDVVQASVIDHLMEANVSGVDSHGLQQIFGYTKSLSNGRINPKPKTTVIKSFGSVEFIDGDRGPGQYLGKIGTDKAIQIANKNGIGLVGVVNSNHYGMAGYYTRTMAEKNMVGFSTSDTNVVDLAPFGGKEPRVGNDPFSWAIPTGDNKPVVLDCACGIVSGGKVNTHAMWGLPIPQGWGFTNQGEGTTDPIQVSFNATNSYKFSGLALISDLLCGPMLGTAASFFKQKGTHNRENGTGHIFLAINPQAFGDFNEFTDEVGRMVEAYKATPKSDETTSIYYPGELEFITKENRLKDGIPLPKKLLEKIKQEYGEKLLGLLQPIAV